jgi:hypothetical protein
VITQGLEYLRTAREEYLLKVIEECEPDHVYTQAAADELYRRRKNRSRRDFKIWMFSIATLVIGGSAIFHLRDFDVSPLGVWAGFFAWSFVWIAISDRKHWQPLDRKSVGAIVVLTLIGIGLAVGLQAWADLGPRAMGLLMWLLGWFGSNCLEVVRNGVDSYK